MPENRTLACWLYDADGTTRTVDSHGKEVATLKGRLKGAAAPEFTAEVKDLVVLSLPYRTTAHVRKMLKLENRRPEDLRFDEARALLAATFAENNPNEAMAIFRAALHAREQRQLGLYVLLAACGQNLDADNGDVLAEHAETPLGQYLALFSGPSASTPASGRSPRGSGRKAISSTSPPRTRSTSAFARGRRPGCIAPPTSSVGWNTSNATRATHSAGPCSA